MIIFIAQTIWLFLPAGIANMSPVLFKWIPFLNTPIDFNLKIKGKPVFGSHKTYRGFFFAISMAILTVLLQKMFYQETIAISSLNYAQINVFALGFLLGFGALFGDLIKSFFKRQTGIASGKSWPIFDQVDWIIGASIFASLYTKISMSQFFTALIIFGILHPLTNIIGYLLKIKKTKF